MATHSLGEIDDMLINLLSKIYEEKKKNNRTDSMQIVCLSLFSDAPFNIITANQFFLYIVFPHQYKS